MNLSEDLKARGLVEHSSASIEMVLEKKRTVYLGVDPSADSMHAGNLLVVLTMRRLAQAGHSIILLVGGGTGMIGDPKEKGERPLIDTKTVDRNKKALRSQMQAIVGSKVHVVDNADWLLQVKLIDFLRDIGKHFTVNELVKRDIIRRRLETPDESISYTEFAYSLLQGYDFMVLNQKYGVDLQIGASDQWTNILSGVELIRRKLGKEAYALCTPLVTDATGKKFGKSEGNAIWLDAKKTSPYQFYQFWLNQPDEVVEKHLKFFTFLSVGEINSIVAHHRNDPGKREAQKVLAREVTSIVHGTDRTKRVVEASEALFGGKVFAEFTSSELAAIKREVPAVLVPAGSLVTDALLATGLADSKSNARRLIEANGVSINNTKVETPEHILEIDAFVSGLALLRRGKEAALIAVTDRFRYTQP